MGDFLLKMQGHLFADRVKYLLRHPYSLLSSVGAKSAGSDGPPKMRWCRGSPGPVGSSSKGEGHRRHLWLNKQREDDRLGPQVWRTD